MKWLFISLFALFFSFCLIRWTYGLDSNSLAYAMDQVLQAVPDVKEDFQVFLEACIAFRDSLLAVSSAFAGGDILKVLSSLATSLLSLVNIVVALAQAIAYFIRDFSGMLEVVIELLFGEVVMPIGTPV